MMTLDSIHNTISFVEAHFDKPISVEDLERVSFYSYRNIQRIFKYTCGETIGGYQQRLKVEAGYKLILYTKNTFSDIAIEVGFENLAAFSKAFKLRFGISPKEARQNKTFLFEKNAILPKYTEGANDVGFGMSNFGIDQNPTSQIRHRNTEGGLKPEKVYLPSQPVYYQSTFTDYENDEIEKLWAKFMQLDFPKNGVDYFGVIADEPLITEKIRCRYDACASVLPKGKDLPVKTLFGGKYAKFLHFGSYETLEETYQKIYTGWILTTQLEFSAAPIIEQYLKHDSNTADEADFLTAILIPLK